MTLIKRFISDRSGSVGLIFGLSLVPVIGLSGAALDYSRASNTRTALQRAADGTALALVSEPITTSKKDLQEKGQKLFTSMFQASIGNAVANPVVVSRSDTLITVSASGTVKTTLMNLVGVGEIPVATSAEASWGTKKIELALVLDTTGSMASSGKMTELKEAVGKLVDNLKTASLRAGDIKASVVPFNTQVNIGTGYRDADWLRWDVKLENRNLSSKDAAAPTKRTWTGCVTDRDQPYDIEASAPTRQSQTGYVAANCSYKPATMLPLTSNLESVRATAKSMQPNGATNVTIGLAMGLATLNPLSPFGSTSSTDTNVQKFLVLLTDGDNTQNRWAGNGSSQSSSVDTRLEKACELAHDRADTKKVQIFTIRVIEGNAKLLKKCASNESMYFDVKDADQLQPAFDKILEAIVGTRLTH